MKALDYDNFTTVEPKILTLGKLSGIT